MKGAPQGRAFNRRPASMGEGGPPVFLCHSQPHLQWLTDGKSGDTDHHLTGWNGGTQVGSRLPLLTGYGILRHHST